MVKYMGGNGCWWWLIRLPSGNHTSPRTYSRRSDAVRGFKRFCEAIKRVK